MNSLINNNVTLGGAQTITGAKSFSGAITGTTANFSGAITGTTANFSSSVYCLATNVNGTAVVQKYIEGNSLLFNELQIQMGFVNSSSGASGTITFSKPFASTLRSGTPKVATSIYGIINEPRTVRIYDTSTTNFKFQIYRQAHDSAILDATAFEYIAIGY